MHRTPQAVAFSTASLVLLLLAAGAAAGLVVLAVPPSDPQALQGLPSNTWWFLYSQGPSGSPLAAWRIGTAVIASLVSAGAVLRARILYSRSPSPALLFVTMFLLSLGLECLRAGTALLAATEGSVALSVLLTRVIYWGRFVGLLGLLLASLYGLEMKYARFMVLGGMVLLVSFAMAAYIPVDRTVFLAQLTWKLGDEQSVWFLNLAIEALVVLSCLAAVVVRGPATLRMSAALVLFIVAREVEFFALQPLPGAAGVIAQAGGALLCLSRWGDGARSVPRRPAG